VIDIKSEINAEKLAEIVAVTQSLGPLNVPTLAFAYEGCLPETLAAYLHSYRCGDGFALPSVIAIHSRNCLAIRGTRVFPNIGLPYFVLDFTPFGALGWPMATAYFFQWYSQILRHRSIPEGFVEGWYDQILLPDCAKMIVLPDGTCRHGIRA
jgi:hypothetical protein